MRCYFFFLLCISVEAIVIANPPNLDKKNYDVDFKKLRDLLTQSTSPITKEMYDGETVYNVQTFINDVQVTIQSVKFNGKKTSYYIKTNGNIEGFHKKSSKEIYNSLKKKYVKQHSDLLKKIDFEQLRNLMQNNVNFGVKKDVYDTEKTYTIQVAADNSLKTIAVIKLKKTYYLRINGKEIFNTSCAKKAYCFLKKMHAAHKNDLLASKAFAIKLMQEGLQIISGNNLVASNN